MTHNDPYNNIPSHVKLTNFQKVLVIQALRPDRLHSSMKCCVLSITGKFFCVICLFRLVICIRSLTIKFLKRNYCLLYVSTIALTNEKKLSVAKMFQQPVNIKLGNSASETLVMLRAVYGKVTMKNSAEFECSKRFKE